jgi:hypothetical protein
MKTLKISDDVHSKLTSLLGELMAESSKMQTYQDAINALLKESVMLPAELIAQTENFIQENKNMGFTTKEEFVRDAIRFRLSWLRGNNECIEVPKEQYEKIEIALKDLNLPFLSVDHFINNQINDLLEKYDEYLENSKKAVRLP